MALTNQQKQAALRKRRADQGLKELRGVWLTPDEEKIIKTEIKKILQKTRLK